jgi:hypothetical protein
VDTSVSEEHAASIFRVKMTVMMMHEDCILITLTLTLKMEAAFSSAILVSTCNAACCHGVQGV